MLMHETLDHWARRFPDEIYVSDAHRELTWGEMRDRSLRLAHWLEARVGRGDRFAMLDRNSPEMIALYFAASRVGAVPVPLNFRLAPREWAYIVGDAGCRLAVVHEDYADSFGSAVPDDMEVAVIRDPDAGTDEVGDFESAVRECPATDSFREVSPDDVFYQLYTSGTTGRPKGAMVTQRSVAVAAHQIQLALEAFRKTTLCVMPMFHAGAAMQVMAYTLGGCPIHVVRDYDRNTVLHLMAERRVQLLTLAPAMIQDMLNDPDITSLDFSALDLLVYGSAPMAVEVIRKAMAVFGCEFEQAYGMTEACVTHVLTPEDHRRALESSPEILASAGRPLLWTGAAVVGPDGRDLPVGEVGEIVVSGPQVMEGYWGRDSDTSAALVDGRLHTGDAGYLDADGYLYVSDRVKDMIISGGENIYPREVEEILFQLPGVTDAAVFGVPSEKWGESPVAVVVAEPDSSLTEEDVVDHCRAHLAGFKCPVSVTFLDALPRNAVGKVLKRELREPHWAGFDRRVN